MIKLATIGTSSITESFSRATALVNEIEHSAVYSRNAATGRAFADKFGISRVFTSLEGLAKSDIDAVYIASPNKFHAEQTRLFLENGKHVICEKPIVTNAAEYIELKAIADKNRLIYMEAITSLHTPALKEVINAKEKIGNIATARIDYCQRSSRYDSFMRGEKQNIFDMSLHAGTLMDLGVYCVYGAVELFGEPKKITASASFLNNGADGSGCAIFDYDGFSAALTYSKTGQSAMGTEIIGDNGTLKIGLVSQMSDVSLITADGAQQLCGAPNKSELMSYEAAAFADFINGKRMKDYKSACEIALIVHRCMDSIKQSANIIYE